ncbi:UPF0481 protein [Vigna angularis]|uniref:UPF0481 protein n=2 Tax=Phaseolus angularis TaxID=3914 RepID=A0A8T0JW72_PHAAN|nr:UPF0481 protein At3g47200 isoform X1 [Vigna angularis]XP_052723514.1 UPF0481 protein At3g47200 isoform X1 [Vigna angularis]KAG2384467.1 UPF0481 protein [Vigna angularis]BAU01784.1 hypothetical protein VIGAN_11109200 [Vigna angularis var. angularis]
MGGRSRDLAGEIQSLEREWTEMLQDVKPPDMDEFHRQCIYRVPPNIREYNPKAYTPQIVSIGPYHKVRDVGKEDNIFQSMETLKLKYLKGFLDRTNMRDLVVKMKELEESNIQSCYAETIESNDDFLKMILVDACFIIELFLRWHRHSDWKGKDRLMQKPRMLGYIELDLLLLENQLPFCVLDELHKLTGMNENFLDITLKYFESRLFGNMRPEESPKHFTDLLISTIISSSKLGLEKLERCKEVKHVYSASQLMEAGLKFEVNPNTSFVDLTYSKYGVLSMPILNIHDNTELLFRNMMAYEHCHLSTTNIITQYVVILDFLINTEEDVNILVENKIIVNGDANKVATMFNNLTSQLSIPDFNSHYFSICNSLNEFYENPRNKYKAIFIHEYFNTPWKIASTTAAIMLLLLTFIQTVINEMDRYVKNKKVS